MLISITLPEIKKLLVSQYILLFNAIGARKMYACKIVPFFVCFVEATSSGSDSFFQPHERINV